MTVAVATLIPISIPKTKPKTKTIGLRTYVSWSSLGFTILFVEFLLMRENPYINSATLKMRTNIDSIIFCWLLMWLAHFGPPRWVKVFVSIPCRIHSNSRVLAASIFCLLFFNSNRTLPTKSTIQFCNHKQTKNKTLVLNWQYIYMNRYPTWPGNEYSYCFDILNER